jgi:hypothetical protein
MRTNIYTLREVFLSDTESTDEITAKARAGVLRKIGPRLYTGNLRETPEAIVSRNLWNVVDLLVPDTVVSHRTALDNRPAEDGSIFVSGGYARSIALPSVTIRQLAGKGPVDGDRPFMQSLHIASRGRAFLENLLPSRRSDKVAKTFDRLEIERRLAELLRVSGEDGLNQLRDQARAVARPLGLEDQFTALDGLIAALLRSRPARLTSPSARAYAEGEPYDPNRLPVLDALVAVLRNFVPANCPDKAGAPPALHNVAFYDAYFSNYIEGTDFPVDQAMRIVFDGEMPANRPADAHDVLGTYRLVASLDEMHKRPSNFDDLLAILKQRHAVIMEGRPDEHPGEFKNRPNQAGSTLFVAPELVVGTLRQGYLRYQSLESAFARALFLMFLIAEVHPFGDGNGRMARVMMNAELVRAGQTRIIIPSVYRTEYISSLKRLTNYNDPDAFVRVMNYAQSFVKQIDFGDITDARLMLTSCNAFRDPAEDVKLVMPEHQVISLATDGL